MKLIVGLGNPGKKYTNTRHNLGFMVADNIAQKMGPGFDYEQKYEADIADIDGIKLLKPQTYMNESGQSVLKAKKYYKVEIKNIWVIHDDVDLADGKVRIQFSGTSAGHKGVQSVIDNIGENFWKLRIGVGRDDRIATDDWVLKKLSEKEIKNYKLIIDKVTDYVINSLSHEITEHTIKIEK